MELNQKKSLKSILLVVGSILVLIGIIKASIIGYYVSDLGWLIPLLIVGAICLYISTKIKIRE